MSLKDKEIFKFKPRKKWGQNFLIDKNIVVKILNEADINAEDTVLEIGPGKGILTKEIASKAKKIVAVEIDKKLCAYLSDYFELHENVEIINADFLKLNLHELNEGSLKFKIVANLPYYITSPILMKLLKERVWAEALLMVQKEVAERILSAPGCKNYGRLTLISSYYCDIKLVSFISEKVFSPQPKVNSAIIKLILRDKPRVCVEDERFFFEVIKAAFSKRRKTLINNLMGLGGLTFGKEKIGSFFSELNIPLNIRGEKLSIEQFADLANLLTKKNQQQ